MKYTRLGTVLSDIVSGWNNHQGLITEYWNVGYNPLDKIVRANT